MIKRVTVLLEEELDAEFTAYCENRGFKKSTLAARLIRNHLTAEISPISSEAPQKIHGAVKSRRGKAQ